VAIARDDCEARDGLTAVVLRGADRQALSAVVVLSPHPRVQRTRSSASPRSAPLTRHPSGLRKSLVGLLGVALIALAACVSTPRDTRSLCADLADPLPSGVSPPKLIHHVAPTYPRWAPNPGNVCIRMVIKSDGSVADLKVVRSASPELDAAALDAVRQ